jgi:DNA-binding transcriptional LysR family regulator
LQPQGFAAIVDGRSLDKEGLSVEMREIEIFRTLMHAGSTGKAAALLGISQPAVSQSLKKFETESGLRLFERTRGRLVPTPEAHALVVEVDQYVSGFENLKHRIRSLRQFGLQRLSIAAFPALGTGFMARAIADFGPSERGIQMSLQIMSSREVHQRVTSGRVDFGLMADEMAVSGLESSTFSDLRGVIVMPPGHALTRLSVVPPEVLTAYPFIALNPEDASRVRLETALQPLGLALNPVIETPFANSVCELALRGVGIGMANPVVALDYAARGLVLRRFSLDISFRSLLVFRAGSPLSDNARELLRVMRIAMERDAGQLQAMLERQDPPGRPGG